MDTKRKGPPLHQKHCLIIERTKGYPFFLQEWASVIWNNAEGPEVTFSDAQSSYSETLATLDEGFFKVRIDRLTKAEVQFVKAMAKLGDGPYAMADIAQALKRTQKSLGPTRAIYRSLANFSRLPYKSLDSAATPRRTDGSIRIVTHLRPEQAWTPNGCLGRQF
jgi:hypothetical protein